MNYPGNIKKEYHKKVDHANRGMDLESLINKTNEQLLESDIAVIYKKPTPIHITKYDYDKKRITDAYYEKESTLDYNGVYNGYYIEFDAKSTLQKNLPLSNIANHQIKHIRKVIKNKGIIFLIIWIQNKLFALSGEDLLFFIDNDKKKSIPYNYIDDKGINVKYNYLKGIDYIPAVEELIRRKCEKEIKS